MPQEFVRRDVQLAIDQLETVTKTVDNLRKLTNLPESGRPLSIVATHLETAGLYLRDLAGKTAEGF